MTPHAKAKMWLKRELKKHGFTVQYSHPTHACMSIKDSPNYTNGNVWITSDISLMAWTGKGIQLEISGNRCGPEARSTMDGPQEIDFSFGPSIHLNWPEVDEAILSTIKETVNANVEELVRAHKELVAKYSSNSR